MTLLQENWCNNETWGRIAGLCPTLRNFAGKEPIALLAFLADLKDMFDNFGVYNCDAVCVLAYLLSNGAKGV